MGIFQQAFHTAIGLNKLFSGFIAYPRKPRNIVHGISHHAQIIDDLKRVFYLKFFLYLGDTPNFNAVTHTCRAIHKNIFRYQLCKVLIWGNHIGLKAFFFSLFGQGSNNVVGFIAFLFNYGDMHGF